MNIDLPATLIALLTFFGISAIMALSLNLEYGIAGVPNFGQALFVSIGAYTAGWTYTRLLPLLAGQATIDPCGATLGQALQLRAQIMKTLPLVGLTNFVLTLLIAALIGGTVGYLASYPALRLKQEWYLGLVLLVGSEVVRIVVRGYEPIICGNNGLSGLAQPFHWVGATPASLLFAGLVLTVAALTYLYCERLARSPYGRLLKAVRENDRVAASLGKEVARIRGGVMLIGSALAALAGVFFVINSGYASANDYGVALTLDLWVMIVLGGLGNNRGALLGALLITVLDRVTAITAIQLNRLGAEWEFNYVRYILFGVILLLMLRFRPQGLLPEPTRTTSAAEVLGG
ncbi:MAG: branched-chain amino acid ABC transporter permease [Chloroflexota bacterium]|nr:branched-chain amino acid ABC transporter permease [Chloroflexota bacterium]